MRRLNRIGAVLVLAVVGLFAACAHLNSPGDVVSCLAIQKDESALAAALGILLDQPNAGGLLDALIASAPADVDAIRCLLRKQAARVGAGGVEGGRAQRAQAWLDANPGT